ncbi:MAG: CBS domain-containing protein [Actinomycetota bacterium]
MKVRDVMSQEVCSVRTDTPVRTLVELMSDHDFSGMPVVTEDGCVLGVVSQADVVAKEALTGSGRDLGAPERRRRDATVAGELMTTPAVVIDIDDDLRAAARLLTKYAVKRVPVVSNGKLCGVVSRRDVMRTFLRSDEDIRTEIVANVLGDLITDRMHDVRVDVRDGVVTLRGTVYRRSTAALIAHHVDLVDGVTRIVNGLLWAVDDIVPAVETAPIVPVQERI